MNCEICGGDGWLDEEQTTPCQVCEGTGELQRPRGRVKAVEAVVILNKTKLDSIIAEQASQRADLTAALTQIWNKVKDL